VAKALSDTKAAKEVEVSLSTYPCFPPTFGVFSHESPFIAPSTTHFLLPFIVSSTIQQIDGS
jgi:hypothetical protein